MTVYSVAARSLDLSTVDGNRLQTPDRVGVLNFSTHLFGENSCDVMLCNSIDSTISRLRGTYNTSLFYVIESLLRLTFSENSGRSFKIKNLSRNVSMV